MTIFDKEIDMVNLICRLLNQSGYQVFREVAYYGRRIDVLAVRNETFWAYEAKLAQWPRALEQARWHVTGVDYSSVVLPLPIATRLDRGAFEAHGIGLMGLAEGNWVVFVEPVTSWLMWEPAKEQLTRTVQSFRDAGTPLCIL